VSLNRQPLPLFQIAYPDIHISQLSDLFVRRIYSYIHLILFSFTFLSFGFKYAVSIDVEISDKYSTASTR
jgi:hypothetical protein